MSEKSTELVKILNEQGLDESNSKAIIEAFGGPFEEAGAILASYAEIKVTDESDVEGMNKAKEARLVLKRARTTAENGRKALKSDILKQGKAIDNVARFVKETIEPAEKYLKEQEDFAKLAQEKRDAEKKAARLEKLAGFQIDTSIYNIDLMTDEAFDSLVEKLNDDAKRVEEELLAAENKKTEKAEAERKHQAEIQAENERLKKEAAEKEKRNAVIRDRINKVTALGLVWTEDATAYVRGDLIVTPEHLKEYTDEVFNQLLDSITFTVGEELRIENEKQAAIKTAEEAKLAEERARAEADRKERERLQKDADERLAAEQSAKEQTRLEREKQAEVERALLVAPDKDKIHDFLGNIDELVLNHKPAVNSEEAMSILTTFHKTVAEAIKIATEKTEKL